MGNEIKSTAIAGLFLLASYGSVTADSHQQSTTWDSASAQAAIASVDTTQTVLDLQELTIAGADFDVLTLLANTQSRNDWPEPARDAAIHRFTQSLRAMAPDMVGAPIVVWLKHYESNTMIPNLDHPGGVAPLFNIRASAAGMENSWKRELALLEGLALLRSNPLSLADAYGLELDPAVLSGLRQSLMQAEPTQLDQLNTEIRQRLKDKPALTPLYADSAKLSQDPLAILDVLESGSGPAVAPMLRSSREVLDLDARQDLLLAGLTMLEPENQSLLIAELAPDLVGTNAVDKALLKQLADPAMGSSAALALAHSPSAQTHARLLEVAEGPDRSAAARATLALKMSHQVQQESNW